MQTRLFIHNQDLLDKNSKFFSLVKLLDESLAIDWEIYVTPFCNGLNPDIVLLNHKKGIHVIDAGLKSLNVIERLRYIQSQFKDLYCPRAQNNDKNIIFYSYADIEKECSEIDVNPKKLQNLSIIDQDIFENKAIDKAIPLIKSEENNDISEYVDDLKSWLNISDFKHNELDEIITLDRHQRNLVDTRTESGLRRIRGSAGSGKTLVLAFKAAKLISEGKSVLILTYNITLINYIRSLVFKGLKNYKSVSVEDQGNWQIQWFHNYVKNYFINIKRDDVWNDCYNKNRVDQRESNMTLVPERFLTFLNDPDYGPTETFDAVLVDEGSDFVPEMWFACRMLINKKGEGYLVKDGSQDIYQRDSSWTDKVMEDGGFTGPWNFLKETYRMPYAYVPKIKSFIDMCLLDQKDINYPINEYEPDIFSECNTSWFQISENNNHNFCIKTILKMLPLTDDFAYANILFLSLSIKSGKEIVSALTNKKIEVAHTFYESSYSGRSSKVAFDLSDERVKATTVYSIKGFEGPMIVLQILPRAPGVSKNKQAKLIYTGLTRLRLGMNSKCHINVVCSDPDYAEYGKTWKEDFYEI